jgi:hypothetical protein
VAVDVRVERTADPADRRRRITALHAYETALEQAGDQQRNAQRH